MIIGTFRIGEDITIALDAASGIDPASLALPVADMLAVIKDDVAAIAVSTATLIPLTVSTYVASGANPAGWTLLATHTATAALAPGIYAIDARIVLSGGVIDITDQPAFIRLTKAAVS